MDDLTKKEALEQCRRHWQYMAEHPTVSKGAAFDILWPNTYISNDCWCCEYGLRSVADTCCKCPLWPAEELGYSFGCERSGSPYADYVYDSGEEQTRKTANEIVRMCSDALDAMEDTE